MASLEPGTDRCMLSAVALAMATTSSCLARGTSMRVSAEQVWPELRKQPKVTPSGTARR